MNVAIAQINTTPGDIAGNKEKILEAISRASQEDVDLVVFGEMALSGMPLLDIVNSPDFIDKCYSALSEVADASKGLNVLVGMPTTAGDDIFNSVAYITDGKIKRYFSKAMPMSREEISYFAGIDSPTFFDEDEHESESIPDNIIWLDNKKYLIVIGEDIQFIDSAESFAEGMALPESIIHISARKFVHETIKDDIDTLSELAARLRTPIISVNLVGGNGTGVFYGASTAFNATGALVKVLKKFAEDYAVIDIERKSVDMRQICDIPALCASARVRDTYRALSLALRDFVVKSDFSKVCLGLSGGIDSAVVAAIAVKTLGADNVSTLMLPSQFSSDHSVSDAEALARNLGINNQMVEIEPIYNAFVKATDVVLDHDNFSLTHENLQSRIRGVVLMALSNSSEALLLNTTNKSEAAMGYGTLYGDTNGALSLLGDVYKTEVYELAAYINRAGEVIPQSIIDKEPSAELRPNQKDSDSLPEYEVLDKILYHLIEEGLSVLETSVEGFDVSEVVRVDRLLKGSEYKRAQIPPVVKVSRCTLGEDRVIPIISKF